jgi:hypothetical protein
MLIQLSSGIPINSACDVHYVSNAVCKEHGSNPQLFSFKTRETSGYRDPLQHVTVPTHSLSFPSSLFPISLAISQIEITFIGMGSVKHRGKISIRFLSPLLISFSKPVG